MYRKNVSAALNFAMVTTGGVADAAATVNVKRILDQTLSSATGNVINQSGGAYSLIMSSADNNANSCGFFFTASGDVPLMITFPTTAADPTNATSFGLANLDSSVGSRLSAAGVPTNFAALGLSSTGHVLNVDTLQIYISNTPQSGDAFARVGAAGVGLTNLGDTRIANLDSTVSSRMGTFTLPTNFNLFSINASGQVVAASVAAGGIGSTAFTTAALNAIADAILDRNMATGVDSGSETTRTVRQSLRFNRNKVDAVNGQVFKEDDTTQDWTFAVTRAAGNPITVIDPTGP